MDFIAQKIYTKNGFVRENIFPGKKVLHLGCGHHKLSGAIGIDILPLGQVDITHDLDKMPWPLLESSFDVILAHSVVEHLSDIVALFDEIWRLAKPGARVVITVPYFRCIDSFTDITHKHFFTSSSLDYFIKENNSLSNYCYTNKNFKKIGFWHGWPQESDNFFVRSFKGWVSHHPRFFDQYLSLLFPVKILIWELEVGEKSI